MLIWCFLSLLVFHCSISEWFSREQRDPGEGTAEHCREAPEGDVH